MSKKWHQVHQFNDRVLYVDILHIPLIIEQHPLSYDDMEPSIPSVTIIPTYVQDDDIPPPILAKTNKSSDTELKWNIYSYQWHNIILTWR